MNPIKLSDIEEFAIRLKSDSGFKQENWAVTSTWASKLGHPCGERWLYFLRTNWEQMEKRDWKGIGKLGNLIHDDWKIEMMKKGYAIIQNEAPLSEETRRKYGIGGRIDGYVSIAQFRARPYEFKSMHEAIYEKINSVEDMLEHSKAYIRSYPAQLQTYLFDKNEEEGFFILCNKSTLEWKVIVVRLDYGYVEALLKRAEAVKNAYDKNIMPNPFPRIPYGSTCQSCEFAHICLPDIINDGLEFEDNQHLEELLKDRDDHADAHKHYKKVDEEVKIIAKQVGAKNKKFIVGTSHMIEIFESPGTRVDTKAMTPEDRKKYEVPTKRTEVCITPLNIQK